MELVRQLNAEDFRIMTETSTNILDADIEDILGDVDEDISFENIDADAILGEVDEFLAENAIKPEKSVVTSEPAMPEEEQLDYDEDNIGEESKQKNATSSSSDVSVKRERHDKKGYNNFDDGNYYINPNFRGSFPPDMMGMPPRGPPFMSYPPGLMHPRYYHGYRGPPPLRYQMMDPGARPPFPPHMYGPPMGVGPRGPYGGPPQPLSRGSRGRFAGDNRRHTGVNGDKPEQSKDGKKTEKNEEVKAGDAKKEGSTEGNGSKDSLPKFQTTTQNPQKRPSYQGQPLNSQRPRTSSSVNRLPTVRIGGSSGNTTSGHASSASSSQTSVKGSSSQMHIPSVSNVNAIISASLRLPLNPPQNPPVRLPVTPLSQQPQQILPPQPLINNPPPLMILQPQNLPVSTNASFTPTSFPVQQQPQSIYINPSSVLPMPAPVLQPIVSTPSVGGNSEWSLMVDAFVKKTSDIERSQRHSISRSSSRSRSSVSDGRSYSRSFSGSSSRSRSRSPIPTRSPRSPLPPRRRSRGRRNERIRNKRYPDKRSIERGFDRRPKREDMDPETKEDLKHSRECAEAIGLDEEYLRKMEEQKRLREEFTRLRSQKRQQTLGKNGESVGRPDSRRPDSRSHRREPARRDAGEPRGRARNDISPSRANAHRARSPEERIRRNGNRAQEPSKLSRGSAANFTAMPNTSSRGGGTTRTESHPRSNRDDGHLKTVAGTKLKQEPSASENSSSVAGGKLKAYLAVVVSNVKELENPYKRIVALTDAIGLTKKVWQTSEDTISIIFVKNEHAKQFMLQYHGKSLAGKRLDVSLEKVFLNLTSMPS